MSQPTGRSAARATARPRLGIVNQPLDALLPPQQNSVGIWSYQVARRLVDHYDVTVYGKRNGSQPQRQVVDQGVSYRFLRALPVRLWQQVARRLAARTSPRRPLFAAGIYFADYALAAALALRQDRCELILVHGFTQFLPLIRALNPGARILLFMAGEWLSQLDPLLLTGRLADADGIYGCSDYITAKIRARFPRLADRCGTLHFATDTALFTPAPAPARQRRLLYVGRLSPEKGVHDLLDAFALVARQDEQVQLELVGPPGALPRHYIVDLSDDPRVRILARHYESDYQEQLQARIPEDLRSRVHFAGFLAQSELVDRYQRSALLVNPSLSESFGMSLVEAMATHTPVLATRVGGMVEITADGRYGRLVEPGRPAELAAAIRELLHDPGNQAGQAAQRRRRVVDNYSWDAVAEATRKALESQPRRPAAG